MIKNMTNFDLYERWWWLRWMATMMDDDYDGQWQVMDNDGQPLKGMTVSNNRRWQQWRTRTDDDGNGEWRLLWWTPTVIMNDDNDDDWWQWQWWMTTNKDECRMLTTNDNEPQTTTTNDNEYNTHFHRNIQYTLERGIMNLQYPLHLTPVWWYFEYLIVFRILCIALLSFQWATNSWYREKYIYIYIYIYIYQCLLLRSMYHCNSDYYYYKSYDKKRNFLFRLLIIQI